MKFSSRSSAHLTVRPAVIAAAATSIASGAGAPLLPNAPPTSGTITWIDSSGRSSTAARPASWRWLSCADTQTVSMSSGLVVGGDRAARLHRHRREPRQRVARAHDVRGGLEGAVDVAR